MAVFGSLKEINMTNLWKNTVSKDTIEVNVQKFYDCVTEIESFNVINIDTLTELLSNLESGCNGMTDNYCRVIWKAAASINIEDINDTCSTCKFYPVCSQNPDNRLDDRLYYNICLLWSEVKNIVNNNIELTIELSDKIFEYVENVKLYNSEVDTFKSIVDSWEI
jgi:hypothetical protein